MKSEFRTERYVALDIETFDVVYIGYCKADPEVKQEIKNAFDDLQYIIENTGSNIDINDLCIVGFKTLGLFKENSTVKRKAQLLKKEIEHFEPVLNMESRKHTRQKLDEINKREDD
ncbi:hypothetical protein [Endozoicomonas sp. SCSIO W0465]|uniref:hypothetical protein n=1 Tax=Endozoicomonas sp. SCSIO W0465 TaxID=2918516 RepID=UPI0020759DD2|nr:hypothetical protein [Endozoicomonas sp. SCSIO W0465]USE39542.1 hypothetical protein MJO57_16070 [Endozoicomonas sp. SCSIO W0465]